MPSPGPDPVDDPLDDESGDLEQTDSRGPRGFGATRPGAVGTLLVIMFLVLLFQSQLLETRHRGVRSRATNIASVGGRESPASVASSFQSSVESAPPPEREDVRGRADRMRGRLVDPRGRPVAAAEVKIGQQTAITEPDGSFTLAWAGGDFRATHPDFWSRELRRSSLVLLRELDGLGGTGVPRVSGRSVGARLPILLVPGARVSGSVRVETEPASGARVVISTGQRRWEVLAEADGTFASPLLPVTNLSLLVLYPGTQPSLTVLPPTAANWHHRVEVSLRRGVPFKVRVENDRKRPVGDAEVWLRTVPNEDEGRPGATVEWEFVGWTDDLGRVDSARASHRPVQIQVRTPGYETAIRPFLVTESHVRLRPAPSLIGRAVDAETGLPLELRSVRLEVRQEGAFVSGPDHGQQSQALGGGRFIVGLPPFAGLYRVSLRGAGNRSGLSTAVKFDGREAPAPLLVSLDRRTVIAGCVRGDSGAVQGAPVELLSVPDVDAPGRYLHGVRVPPEYRVIRSETTDHEGRFEFGEQGPGLYRVHVQLDGQREYYSPIFCPPLDEELPIQLGRGSTLSGYLVNSEGIAEANVPLVLTDGDAVTRIARTDGAGSYEFRELPGGEYRLGLGSPARQRARRAVEMRELTIDEGSDLKFNMRRSRVVEFGGVSNG